MSRVRFFFRAGEEDDQRLDAVRMELEAARVLVLDLHNGAYPACIHLVRAARLLERITGNGVGEDQAAPPRNDAGAPAEWPGLDARRRQELETHFPVVQRSADAIADSVNTGERDLGRSVRIVHDLLEDVLLAVSRHRAEKWSGWRRVARAGGLVAGALAVVGAMVVGGVLLMHRAQAPPEAQQRPVAVERSFVVSAGQLATPKAEGTPWDAPGTVKIPSTNGGLVVRLGHRSTAKTIQLSLDNNDRYRIEFLDGTVEVGHFLVGPTPDRGGLTVYEREVPETAVASGFDAVRIVPMEGDGAYSIGHLVLDPPVPEQRTEDHHSSGASASQ